ncbi:hypothetical protein B0J13DRAFT_538820 [Dactylonectria estremocensis]|uniref:Uncharacterized protein n=1 Tax=Dactylonectria estremocensis TaxID=1079267 RepID=A0A9P9FJP3_9HYPO|nr:hypothetical protein B0J13DRAFT_538820 [Dactylonectria estremocensis]
MEADKARWGYCQTCVEQGGSSHPGRFPLMKTDTDMTNPEDGYSYCVRHRCNLPGCRRPRGGDPWRCKRDALRSAARDLKELGASKSWEISAAVTRPESSQLSKYAQRFCQVCGASFVDLTSPGIPPGGPVCCSRHRCSSPGCYKPREPSMSPTIFEQFRPFSRLKMMYRWTCAEHNLSNSKSSHRTKTKSRRCEACGTPVQDASLPIVSSEARYFSRHQCDHASCSKPQVEPLCDGNWLCDKNDFHTPAMPSGAETRTATPPQTPPKSNTYEPPLANQRHSRVRSMLNWRLLLRSRTENRAEFPALDEAPAPMQTEAEDFPIEPPPRYSTVVFCESVL